MGLQHATTCSLGVWHPAVNPLSAPRALPFSKLRRLLGIIESRAMTIDVAAIYENGILRPRQPLELAEGTEVRLTISVPPAEPIHGTGAGKWLLAEIDRLAALGPNWDGYGGPALDRTILEAARRFVTRLAPHVTQLPLVVPMSSGAVQFEWHQGQKILEMEVENPATIHYLKWDPAQGTQEEDVFGIDDVETAVALLRWFTGARVDA